MKSIVELIADIPTNAVLRLRAQALEKKVIELEAENARLVKRVSELEGQALAASRSDEFVEYGGAFFKRKPGGGYAETPYCFHCKSPMSSHMNILPYHCKCGHDADFTGSEVPMILLKLRNQ